MSDVETESVSDEGADFVGAVAEPIVARALNEQGQVEPVREQVPAMKATEKRGGKDDILAELEPLRDAIYKKNILQKLPVECRDCAAAIGVSVATLGRVKASRLTDLAKQAAACGLRAQLSLLNSMPAVGTTDTTGESKTDGGERPIVKNAPKVYTRATTSGPRNAREAVGEDGLTVSQRAAVHATQAALILAKGVEDISVAAAPGGYALVGFHERLSEPSSRAALNDVLAEMIRDAQPGSMFHRDTLSPEVRLAIVLAAAAAPSLKKVTPPSGDQPNAPTSS